MQCFIYILAALSAIFFVPLAAVARPEQLPVTLDAHGRMTVPIEIYGRMKTRQFLFDSAAQRTLILNKDSGAMGIKPIKRGTLNHRSSGGLVRLPAARFDAFLLGDRIVEDAIVGFYPDWASSDGLLGNDVFHARILHWQPNKAMLNVYPNAGPISTSEWHNIGGKANRYFGMILTTQYRGIEIDILVATGASHTVIHNDTYHKLFADHGRAGEEERERREYVQAIDPTKREAPVVTLPGFSIGAWTLGDIQVLEHYLPVQEISGYMNADVMILGADILSKTEVAFDFRDFQLWYRDQSSPARTIAAGTTPPTQ
jgi:hypothetical protein